MSAVGKLLLEKYRDRAQVENRICVVKHIGEKKIKMSAVGKLLLEKFRDRAQVEKRICVVKHIGRKK